MEFQLDPGQVELQETVARFCADRWPLDAVAEREGVPVDRVAWRELAALGVFGLLVPEDRGGSGLTILDAALVFEQLGAHLVPGPVLWSVLAAPRLSSAADGEAIVGGVEAAAVGGGVALVEHATDLDLLLVLHHDRVVVHRMADVPVLEPLTPLDPLTPVARVMGLEGGETLGDGPTATWLERVGTVLTAAALVGVAGQALETARAHALEREQFGVPIGSFQAVKHLLADRYVAVTLAQSATYAAAAVLDDPGAEDPDRSAAAAKLLAAEAAIDGAGTAIQVLGGMGFTWAMPPHHLLKRAWVLEQSFGDAGAHALALGRALEDDAA
jgi:alkylation response protein AidB-like acyl-CoA dehydrogenase